MQLLFLPIKWVLKKMMMMMQKMILPDKIQMLIANAHLLNYLKK